MTCMYVILTKLIPSLFTTGNMFEEQRTPGINIRRPSDYNVICSARPVAQSVG